MRRKWKICYKLNENLNSKFGKNNENNLTFENKRCIFKINSINGRWIKMFNLEELSLESVEISELKTSKNLFGPVMYGTGVRM